MQRHVNIDPLIFERFAGYEAFVVFVSSACIASNEPWPTELLLSVARERSANLASTAPEQLPVLAAWRHAYELFGAKSNKYHCSVESMFRRIAKKGSVATIGPVVDLYNAVSLRHALPIGGEDFDKVAGSPKLTYATGSEIFETLASGDVEHTLPGEVVWRDGVGITCRRWNWRQCRRTMILSNTTQAYFVIDKLPPAEQSDAIAATRELASGLLRIFKGSTVWGEKHSASGVESIQLA